MNILTWLNNLNVFWSCAGLFLVILLLSLCAKNHQDPRWVFTHYENDTGFENPYYVFLLGMIGAAYSLFGSECSASMNEETKDADISSPIAMITSILTAWIFGFVYLMVLLFSIQDVDVILTTTFNMPVAQLFWDAVGPFATVAFLVLMIVCQFCSGSTSLTVASRQIFTLARGGGVPYHDQLQQLNKHQLPGNAVMATSILACCFVLPYPLSDYLFEIIISAATITVHTAYSVVLGCRLFVGSHDGKKGRFHLGYLSKPITALGFAWTLIAVFVFMLPTCWPIDGKKKKIFQ
ncbi:amino acid/polyamine transporter I [Halteromyces radiatus]|uniref:amino acid/polyamine transporter I n=1 Tax=Halteromyces radiatus TaxID=101107 RepID=UPI002220256F|nr:amino acid/polyamine transporter I [Halteromyces radiatus]KAI8089584.1 amino acid/polyamine transporter I [Halteromyces radiatus]